MGEEKADVPSLPSVNFRSILVAGVPGPDCFFSARNELKAEETELVVCDIKFAVVPTGETVEGFGLLSSGAVPDGAVVVVVEGDGFGDFIARTLAPAAIITPWDGTVGSSLLLLPAITDGGVPKAAFTGVIKELALVRPLIADGDVFSSVNPVFGRTDSEGGDPVVCVAVGVF